MLRTPFSGGSVTQSCQLTTDLKCVSVCARVFSLIKPRQENSREMKLPLAVIATSQAKLVNFDFPDPVRGELFVGNSNILYSCLL